MRKLPTRQCKTRMDDPRKYTVQQDLYPKKAMILLIGLGGYGSLRDVRTGEYDQEYAYYLIHRGK